MTVTFAHESGSPSYRVPGYFAADGNAANTSATAGNKWRAHLAPDKTGRWTYRISFVSGKGVALPRRRQGSRSRRSTARTGTFRSRRPTRRPRLSRARAAAVRGQALPAVRRQRRIFPEVGADSPETLLAYADFDGTVALKPQVPLHTFTPHVRDWRTGDPTWKDGKGKGLIGALNYLASKGVNAISFLPYNAGGDGDNVWPFVARDDKFHYDCSKLDQWQIVFDHAQRRASTCISSCRRTRSTTTFAAGKTVAIPESLDAGDTRAGAKAVHARARRPLRSCARAELEHRRRKHAVERAAARDGNGSQRTPIRTRPSHRHPHVSERAGQGVSVAAGRAVALYRCVAADDVEHSARTDVAMGARFVTGEETVGRGQRRARAGNSACLPTPATGLRRKRCKGGTSATRSMTSASSRCGAI